MKTKNGWLVKDDDLLKAWIKIFCALRQSHYYKEFTNEELRELSFIETQFFYTGLHAMVASEEYLENL
jgi:hypothetical protein